MPIPKSLILILIDIPSFHFDFDYDFKKYMIKRLQQNSIDSLSHFVHVFYLSLYIYIYIYNIIENSRE